MSVLLFLLDTLFFALIAACLLRAWMNTRRIRMTQQPGPFVMALTNWLVGPLRRVLPRRLAQHDMDMGSLLGAVLLSLLYAAAALALVGGLSALMGMFGLPFLAIKMLLRSAIQLVMLLAFVYAILSWVQPQASVGHMMARLVEPLLAPIRRIVPLIGGVDLSVLVLILLMQIGLLLLG
jgi:YggT family protein